MEPIAMRYPLWAFFFVLILPPFTAHAVLTGHARFEDRNGVEAVQVSQASPYWTHRVIVR